MLCTFALLLIPSIESCPLEYCILPNLEKLVKLRNDCVIFGFVVGAGVSGVQDSFCFLAETVQQGIDLLPFAVGRQSCGDAVLLESALPSRPVIRISNIKRFGRSEVELSHDEGRNSTYTEYDQAYRELYNCKTTKYS